MKPRKIKSSAFKTNPTGGVWFVKGDQSAVMRRLRIQLKFFDGSAMVQNANELFCAFEQSASCFGQFPTGRFLEFEIK
jgi:hypothetical protein